MNQRLSDSCDGCIHCIASIFPFTGEVGRSRGGLPLRIPEKPSILTLPIGQVWTLNTLPSKGELIVSILKTAFTEMFQCQFPIIVAPMFLVSNENMVVAGSEAGALGTFPALNYRPVSEFEAALRRIKKRTSKPFGVNVIVNPSNIYYKDHLRICLDEGVPLIIASLGGPKELIDDAHKSGIKVVVDVTNLRHALKAQDAGADAIVAVNSAAGGHRGSTGMEVLLPFLKKNLSVPIISAGGIAGGEGLLAALSLGAVAVQIGTRFIASKECQVAEDYKKAIINSNPEDIVTTYKLDGIPAHVINTAYIKKMGTDLSFLEKMAFENRSLRRLIISLRTILSLKMLTDAAEKVTWKQVWGAGQVVGLIDSIDSISEIIASIMSEYEQSLAALPRPE